MKNMFYCVLAWSLMSSTSVLAAGSDEMWEVTIKTKSETPGKLVMPAMTSKVCRKKGREDPNSEGKENKDCKTTHKRSGNKWSAQWKCEGEYPMTGSSEGTFGDGTYSTKTKMHTKDGDSTMFEEGKLIGSCNYETDSSHNYEMQGKMDSATEKAFVKQYQEDLVKQQVKECKEALDENRYRKFLKQDCSWATDAASKKSCAQSSCPDLKPQMCDRLSKLIGSSEGNKEIDSSDDYADVHKLIKECGLSYASDKGSASDQKSAGDKKPAGDKKTDTDKDKPANNILDGAKGLKEMFKF